MGCGSGGGGIVVAVAVVVVVGGGCINRTIVESAIKLVGVCSAQALNVLLSNGGDARAL